MKKDVVRIARIQASGEDKYAIYEGTSLYELDGDIYGEFSKGNYICEADESTFLSPVTPETIYGLGVNHKEYEKFVLSIGRSANPEPIVFTKPAHAVVGMSGNLILPAVFKEAGLKGSGELGVVMKKDCVNVSVEEAKDYILGFTNAYDALPAAKYYNASKEEKHEAKGYPTFCPMGPYLVMNLDISRILQRTYYNGELFLEGYTDGYIWDVYETIHQLSCRGGLKKGDVIIMGAMAPEKNIQKNPELFASKCLFEGDCVTVHTEGLGCLKMKVLSCE